MRYWWKILGILLILYSLVWGLLGEVPALPILNESIRNLYFHVTMWFSMMALMTGSFVQSLVYLNKEDMKNDIAAAEIVNTGMFFGLLGILTGMLWARFTWGTWWVNDPKLNGAAVTMLIYAAYLVLRNSIEDPVRKGKVAAVYNVFAFVLMIIFLLVLPRMNPSLHPGSGGNPAFSAYDLDSNMRLVFYPAVLGWILLGFWIAQLRSRIRLAKLKIQSITNDQ